MRIRTASLIACLILASLSSSSIAQLSEVEARQLGLEIAWRSQIQLPRVGFGLVSADLWLEPTEPRKFAVVALEDHTIRVSADKLDRDGKPIGIEMAKTQATQLATRFLGKPGGFQVEEQSVPRIKLILVTSDGLVQAMDAESGTLLWSTSCGNSRAPTYPAALSASGVSVIHGQELYLLDWATGKLRQVERLRSSTSNAIAVCNDLAFVSDFSGVINTYGLGRPRAPWTYVINGRAVGQPVSFMEQTFSAIASDEGYVYIFQGGEDPNVWIRYESSAPLTGSLSSGNNAVYVGTTGGAVAKISVEQRLGSIVWEFRCGQTITASPLVVGEAIYVASESGNVFALSDAGGEIKWISSGLGVSQVIAQAGRSVVCQTHSSATIALDAETGAIIGRNHARPLSRPIQNQQNDRAYLVAVDGRIQCLRPIGAELPTLVMPFVQTAEPESANPEAETPTAPAGNNIFGSGPTASTAGGNVFAEDPFGNGVGGNAADTDVNNPFATPPAGDAEPANPFDGF